MVVGFKVCSLFNLTWAMITAGDGELFKRGDDDYPDGPYFIHYFKSVFLETMSEVKKNKRCVFKWYDQLGKRLENGSFSGSMKGIIQSEVDVHFRPMDYFIEPGLVDHSSVILANNFEIFQTIDSKERRPSSSLKELFSLLVPSMPLLVSFLITGIFFLMAVFLLALIIKKKLQLSEKFSGAAMADLAKSTQRQIQSNR